MIELGAVQNLLAGWWFEYDQGNFDVWPGYFTSDAHFGCRTDSGATDFEEFVNADISGRDALLAWQIDHRRNSPYPLRHHATNLHLADAGETSAAFRSYLFVTQIVGGAVSSLSTAVCLGRVREEEGRLRISALRVVLDCTDSGTFGAGSRPQPS